MGMVFNLYIASLKEFLRDRMTLFWTLAFPVIFIILFGLIFSGSGTTTYTVGLVNLDNGPTGSAIQQAFMSQDLKKIFDVKTGSTVNDENNFQDQLKNGKLDLVLVLPPGLSQNAQANTTTNIEVYNDSSKQQQGQIMLGIVQQVLQNIDQGLTGKVPLLKMHSDSVATTTLRSIDYLVPGILAMSLMQLGLFGTTMPLVSLRERKILRRLGATPLPRWALLVSQVLMRLTIALFQTGLILGIGVEFFGVHIVNPVASLGVVILGALTFIGFGYLLASLARTQDSANGITSAVNFPMMFLSGVFFPLAALPLFLGPIVKALPLTYLADAMRQTMISSTPDFPMTTDLLILAAWVVGCALLSVRLFKWE